MKNFWLGLLLILSIITAGHKASAAGRNFGAGLVIGEPTGLTGKVFLNSEEAIDFGMAFAFSDYALFYGDYLFHFPDGFGHAEQFIAQLTPYVGIGAMVLFFNSNYYGPDKKYSRVANSTSAGFGVRIPLGIEWKPAKPPLGVFVELVPGIGLVPGTFGFIGGGIGVRYYF